MYTESTIMYTLLSMTNAYLVGTGDRYTWTPKKAWMVVGAVLRPTTAIGACSVASVTTIKHTPSGGSLTSKITLTGTASVGVGTEILGVASSTGSDVFDVKVGDTLTVNSTTAMSGGGTTGVCDLVLLLKEKP